MCLLALLGFVRCDRHGLTIALFLAESHIVLTTWPEFRLLLADVLLCNETMDFRRAVRILKDEFCPSGHMTTHEVPRLISDESSSTA